MTFTTLTFAYFFVAVFLLYYIVPKKWQWIVTLLASLVFYFEAGIPGFIMMLLSVMVSWASALFIEKAKNKASLIFAVSVLIFIVVLVLMRTPFGSLVMPLGLSFYTLQCIGYVTEVYRKSTEAQKNPLKVLLYVSFFPHILQGPFEDYNELKSRLEEGHDFNYDNVCNGAGRFALGLLKKLVLADRIGYIVDPVFEDASGYHGFTIIFVMALYTVQLYADFSGYMDMAVGMSKMLGIEIRENFNVPYASKSMAEFWRRWHMSLGLWFKVYVFYPMLRTKLCSGVSAHFKKKKNKYLMKTLPTAIALTVNWTLIGLWHGFDANYLCYDWFCGAVIIFSEFLRPVYASVNDKAPKIFKTKFMDALRVVRTFIIVMFSFMMFRPTELSTSFLMMKEIFIKADIGGCANFIYNNIYDLFLIAVPFVILLVVDIFKYREKDILTMIRSLNPVFRWCIYIAVALLIYVCKGDRSAAGFAYYIF